MSKKIKYIIAASVLFAFGVVLYKPTVEMLEKMRLEQEQKLEQERLLKQHEEDRRKLEFLRKRQIEVCIEDVKKTLIDPNSLVFLREITWGDKGYYGCTAFEFTATNSYGGRVRDVGVCRFAQDDQSTVIDEERTKGCRTNYAIFQRREKLQIEMR